MRKILVRLAGDDGDAAVLQIGGALARRFGARLDCAYVMPRTASVILDASPVAAVAAMFGGGSVADLDKADQERAARSHDAFQAFCRSSALADAPPGPDGVSAGWRQAAGQRDLIASAALSDLVVQGGVWPDPDVASDALFHLLSESGRSVLLAQSTAPDDLLRTVAIAWDDSLQAARALSAALPLLRQTQQIVVLQAGGDAVLPDRIRDHLAWHGLTARFEAIAGSGRSAAGAAAQAAAKAGAGLLVMGAYGYSHMEESILGGFTQDMLNERAFALFLHH
jgi:nucleotide-binding universal stress UspA family protein